MRRIIFSKIGRPVDVLEVVEDAPVPNPGPGQVRIKVAARPINPSDLLFIAGQYGIKPELPAWPGFEGAGMIDAVGEGVDMPIGSRAAFTAMGSWQEYVVVPAHTVIPVPPEVSDEIACQLYVNPFTAWAMVHDTGLQSGDWLLQTAAASAFGQTVIQLCKAKGIKTINTVRRDDHRQRLHAIGADVVVNTETEDLVATVREFAGKQGVKHALDAVGGPLTAKVLECLAPGGLCQVYGLLSLEVTPVNVGLMIFKGLTLRGFWLSEWLARAEKGIRKQAMHELLTMAAAGHLKLPVEASYELDEVHNAVLHAELEGRFGKILLVS